MTGGCIFTQPNLTTMPQQRDLPRTYNKGTLQLTLLSIKRDKIKSGRSTIAVYKVPKSTLYTRRAGRPSRSDCVPNSKRLTELEEELIVTYIINLDLRGIRAIRSIVKVIANNLLAERGEQPVSKHWVGNFNKRLPEIKLRRNYPYDRQRALNEDLRIIYY